MKTKLVLAVFLALVMSAAACTPTNEQSAANSDSNAASTGAVQNQTSPEPTQARGLQMDLLPKIEDGADVLYAAPGYGTDIIKLKTFRENGRDRGGRLTYKDDSYSFILSPDLELMDINFVMVIDEKPYEGYYFVDIEQAHLGHMLYVYSVESDLPICITDMRLRSVGKDTVTLMRGIDMFGTWSVWKEYTFTPGKVGTISQGFTPIPDSLWTAVSLDVEYDRRSADVINVDYYRKITLKDFNVYLKGTDGEYEEKTLPKGTRLMPTKTDGKHTVYFETLEGVEGYIDNYEYNESDYYASTPTIGGVPEDELIGYVELDAGTDTLKTINQVDYWEGGTPAMDMDEWSTSESIEADFFLTDEQLESIRSSDEYKG